MKKQSQFTGLRPEIRSTEHEIRKLWIRGKKLKTPGVAFGYAERRRSQSFDKLRTSLSQMENNLSPREANCNGRRQSLGLLTEKTEHRRQETTNHKNRGGESKFKVQTQHHPIFSPQASLWGDKKCKTNPILKWVICRKLYEIKRL